MSTTASEEKEECKDHREQSESDNRPEQSVVTFKVSLTMVVVYVSNYFFTW